MNRKDRRAAAKGQKGASAFGASASGASAAAPGNESAALFTQAIRHHQAGELREAERAYRAVLAREPGHVKSLNLLGLLSHQTGRNDAAADLIGQAIALQGDNPESHYNLAVVLTTLGRLGDAIAPYQRAIALRPDYAEAIMNLGNARMQQGDTDAALQCYERVLALRPETAAAHYNIANIFAKRGQLDSAAARYRQAIALHPDLAEGHNNLGNVFREQGRADEAMTHYRRATAIRADYVAAYDNQARLLLSSGNLAEAFDLLRRALAIGPTDDTKILLVRCLQNLRPDADDPDLRALILRAFSENWVSGNELAQAVGLFLKQAEHIRAAMAKANAAWPARLNSDDLLGASALAALADDRLLTALLTGAAVCDIELERLLTNVRLALLRGERDGDRAIVQSETGLRLCCAVARQCFINEYVFDQTPEETADVARLREAVAEALASGATVAPLRLAVLAAYVPLHAVGRSDNILGKNWPKPLDALVTQQVREPAEELRSRATIPALTPIDDRVSIEVRQQYEANPYPRWVMAPAAGAPVRIEDDLRSKLPHARIEHFPSGRTLDILVAGCGTGRHTIETARRFADTRIQCIDLSMASLAYAKRKTRELGLAGIDYAQADILKLGGIGRSFDVIESNGVLHHLGDPFAGWRVLVGLLRPHGLMNIGLYSAAARRDVTAVRDHIVRKAFAATADGIRACRQDLIAHPEGSPQRNVTRSREFFSTSACRDLLFHVQEHQLTLPQIAAFLAANDLRFLGFEIDIGVQGGFAQKFSDPHAVTDLDCWQTFEEENPRAFAGMYQFWVQKNG
jgi:tetratricopeptide (TPR) repeat protein/SAM-dependent methyltransferase